MIRPVARDGRLHVDDRRRVLTTAKMVVYGVFTHKCFIRIFTLPVIKSSAFISDTHIINPGLLAR